ncbi:hypothetical protein PPTG_01649 [Phytophthora nicotianae INRA-310]|uniref:PiggyBac transposable element-derived protein domain-containing protein n=1 Tax=Phytophthora nicotianae (strain INRA-310) TaxID=761204 RepID=W2R7V7_PHYN3|nr:hypothetical protein PPTG_01649 [Phytophthora nicotianae INRA-310]ETN21487.1 hypothetical protein PPTG_01649 [Phytophthora nicotianae INRA-310]
MDITELLNAVDNASSDWEFDDDEPDLSVEDGVASDEASADLAVEEEEEEVEAGEESQPAQGSVRRTGNEYIENLIRDSGLHIIREREGKELMTSVEMDAFFGLEIATSISPFTELAEFWSTKLFLGQNDFASTMPRNRYQNIRGKTTDSPS